MSQTKLLVDIFGAVLETILLAYYYSTILKGTSWPKSRLLALYSLAGVLNLLSATLITQPMLRTLCYLGIVLQPAIAYGGKWTVKIFYACFFAAMGAGVESLTKSILISYYGGWFKAVFLQNYIQGVFISKFLLVILTLAFLYRKQEKVDKISFPVLGMFLILPISTMIIIYQMMAVNYALEDSFVSIISAIGTGLLILTNIVLFYLFNKQQEIERIKRTMALNDQQQASNEATYQQMSQQTMAHNKLVHDMNNHLIAMTGYAQKGEVQPLLDYLDQLHDWSDRSRIYYTGHIAIDSILNAKLVQAETQGIDLRYQLIGVESILIEPMAVVTVLANGLDNALEATAWVGASRRLITCQIKAEASYLTIVITNPIAKPLAYQLEDQLPTTKTDNMHHGFGLNNIAATAKAYHGSMQITPRETTFTLTVMMQNRAIRDQN